LSPATPGGETGEKKKKGGKSNAVPFPENPSLRTKQKPQKLFWPPFHKIAEKKRRKARSYLARRNPVGGRKSKQTGPEKGEAVARPAGILTEKTKDWDGKRRRSGERSRHAGSREDSAQEKAEQGGARGEKPKKEKGPKLRRPAPKFIS